jgi:hypothetical protein
MPGFFAMPAVTTMMFAPSRAAAKPLTSGKCLCNPGFGVDMFEVCSNSGNMNKVVEGNFGEKIALIPAQDFRLVSFLTTS